MDRMDYVSHGGPSRPAAPYDPVHAAQTSSWMPQQQNYFPAPWMTLGPDSSSLPFGMVRAPQSSEHPQDLHNAVLPPLEPHLPAPPGASQPYPRSPMPPTYWMTPSQFADSMADPAFASPHARHRSTDTARGAPPVNAGRATSSSSNWRAAAADFGPAGVTSEQASLHPWAPFAPAVFPAVTSETGLAESQSSQTPVTPAPPPTFTPLAPSITSPVRFVAPHHPSRHMPSGHRASQLSHSQPPASPSSTISAPAPERRRQSHARVRRSVAARTHHSDSFRETDEVFTRTLGFDAVLGGRSYRVRSDSLDDSMDDGEVQAQYARYPMPSKMIASKSTLQSLESVRIEDLPGNEKTCVICYNDYGVETPEGFQEAPLRLPKCKHVFGDRCIRKWLEDSDSCPYCRDKLHSEPKRPGYSARAFMNAMRMSGLPEERQEQIIAHSLGQAQAWHMELFAERTGLGRAEARAARRDWEAEFEQYRDRPRRSNSATRRDRPQQANDSGLNPSLVMQQHLRRAMQSRYASFNERSPEAVEPPSAASETSRSPASPAQIPHMWQLPGNIQAMSPGTSNSAAQVGGSVNAMSPAARPWANPLRAASPSASRHTDRWSENSQQ